MSSISPFQPIVTPTIREQFVQRITESILSGKLPPGMRLPTEREIAEEMQISKGIVHLGLKDLERMGFIETNPRHGTFVSDYARNGNLETLTMMLKYNGGQLDQRNTESLFEFRMAVEGTAFRKLAARCTQEDLDALREIKEQVRLISSEDPFDISKMAFWMFKFHSELTIRSGNTILPLLTNAFRDLSLSVWENVIRIYGKEESVRHLERFIDYMSCGNGDGAVDYLQEGINFYLSKLPELKGYQQIR